MQLARVKLFRSRFTLRAIIHAAALPTSSSFNPHDRPIGWGLSFAHFTEEETGVESLGPVTCLPAMLGLATKAQPFPLSPS